VRLRLQPARSQPDRPPQPDRGRLGRRAGGLASGAAVGEQPGPDHGGDLDLDGVCHGDPLGRLQGDPQGAEGGGPGGRGQRVATLLARQPALHPVDHRGGGHHHDHQRPEDLRHRLRDDQRQLRHGSLGQPNVQGDVSVPQLRPGRGGGGHPLPGHPALDAPQHPPVPAPGGGALMEREGASPLVHLVIILTCLVWILPTLGLLVSSVRPAHDVAATGWLTVLRNPFDLTQYTLQNYREVLGAVGMGRAFVNSLIITIPATLLTIGIAAFAAFAFAWFQFPGRDVLFLVVVGLLVVPLQMTLIPILRLYSRLGLAGTFVGIWLAHVGYGLPFAIYLLRNFFGSLPADLFESAFIDGASPLTAFFHLALPLSVPALASLGIFQFLWVWNDLLVGLIYLGGSPLVAPLTVRLSTLVGSYGQSWHLLTAAAFVSMAVPMAVFFALQRYFVRGILAGAVKG